MLDPEQTIESVMPTKFHTISEQDTIKDAYDMIMDKKIRALPVLDAGNGLAGIISERDIIRYRTRNILPRHADFYISVSDVMTRDVKTFAPVTRLKDACQQFVDWGHHQVPVVNAEKDKVVGVLGHHDLLRFFSENWENMVDDSEAD